MAALTLIVSSCSSRTTPLRVDLSEHLGKDLLVAAEADIARIIEQATAAGLDLGKDHWRLRPWLVTRLPGGGYALIAVYPGPDIPDFSFGRLFRFSADWTPCGASLFEGGYRQVITAVAVSVDEAGVAWLSVGRRPSGPFITIGDGPRRPLATKGRHQTVFFRITADAVVAVRAEDENGDAVSTSDGWRLATPDERALVK